MALRIFLQVLKNLPIPYRFQQKKNQCFSLNRYLFEADKSKNLSKTMKKTFKANSRTQKESTFEQTFQLEQEHQEQMYRSLHAPCHQKKKLMSLHSLLDHKFI